MATPKKKAPSKPKRSTSKPPVKKAAPAKASSRTAAPKTSPAKPAPKLGTPREGVAAPDFALAGTDGKTHRLADYRGKNLVLYFYPKDNTSGCTLEAIAFQKVRGELAKKNAVVVGVSKDSITSHCGFQEKYGLGFTLLSDPDLSVHGAYGAYGEKMMYGKKVMGVIRSTFVIDPAGKLKKAFPKVKVDGHDAQVLAAL